MRGKDQDTSNKEKYSLEGFSTWILWRQIWVHRNYASEASWCNLIIRDTWSNLFMHWLRTLHPKIGEVHVRHSINSEMKFTRQEQEINPQRGKSTGCLCSIVVDLPNTLTRPIIKCWSHVEKITRTSFNFEVPAEIRFPLIICWNFCCHAIKESLKTFDSKFSHVRVPQKAKVVFPAECMVKMLLSKMPSWVNKIFGYSLSGHVLSRCTINCEDNGF